MNPIDRRSLFSLSAMALGGTLVPDWLARALAIQEPVSAWRVKQLREAIARAKKANKPLLVFVAPAANDGNVRGMWFGAWLKNLRDEDLYLPASCELACATVAELGDVLGAKVEGEPFWVFADVGAVGGEKKPARVTLVTCEVPVVTPKEYKDPADERTTGLLAMRTALVAGAKQHGLELESLAEAAMKRLDDEQKRELDAWLTGGVRPGKALAALAAAEIWRRIGTLPEGDREEPTAVLRAAIRRHVVAAPVAGARWMAEVSCAGRAFEHPTRAERVEKEKAEADVRRVEEALAKDPTARLTPEEIMVLAREATSTMCGRGYVPPLCARFLEFWTAGD